MSAQHLNRTLERRQSLPIPGHDAAWRGELRSALRRRAIENGIDPVRVRGLLHAVDQAVAGILAGDTFPSVVQRLHGAVAALFPASPDLDRVLLEHATSILMVAAIQAGGELSAHVLDDALEHALRDHALAVPVPDRGDQPDQPAAAPAHLRLLRQEVDADPRLQALFASRAVGVCLAALDGTLVKANDRFRAILGFGEPEVMGIRHQTLLQSRFRLTVAQRDAIARHLDGEEPHLTLDALVHRPDGSNAWMAADSTLVNGDDGAARYFLVLMEDVTYQRIAVRALRQGEERFLALLQHSSDIFAIVSRQGRVEYVSRSIARVLGYEPEALHATDFLDLAGPGERDVLAGAIRAALDEPQVPRRIGATLVHRDGTPRWMEIDVTNLDDVAGVSGLVVSARDVTTRKSVEEQLERLAYYDSLTALPNRVQFREKLEEALAAAAETGSVAGVIFIDLDRFKAINDRFGHDGGDSALVAVGQHLTTAMRPGDLAARFGGDEFAILLRDTSPAQAMRVARRVIRAVGRAFPARDTMESLGVSAGVALWSEELQGARALLHAADVALYRSKARGGGVATLYRPELGIQETDRDIRGELQLALERHELEPWYLPEIDLATGALRGLALQPRWNRPGQGLVDPRPFMGVAAGLGIVAPLELDVLGIAVRHVASWQAEGFDLAGLVLSATVAPASLHYPGYVDRLRDTLRVLPRDLVTVRLELDDSVLADPPASLPGFVTCAREAGLEVAAGPFAGGYGSWRALRELGISAIRIEPGRDAQPPDDAVLGAFTALARQLGIATVAAGLETREEADLALAAGCVGGQGPVAGPARPAAEVPALLRRHALTSGADRV